TDSGGNDAGGDSASSDAASDGTVTDAPAVLLDGGGGITDATPGGDAASLNCGQTSCNLPVQSGCVYPIYQPPPPHWGQCSNGATCPALDSGTLEAGPAVVLQCETQANCPGNTVCCIHSQSSDGGTVSAHCSDQNSCFGDGGKSAQLCDPGSADAGCL